MDLGEGHRYEVKEGIMRRNGVWFMDSTGTSCGPGEVCKPLFWRQPQLEAPLQACDWSAAAFTHKQPWAALPPA